MTDNAQWLPLLCQLDTLQPSKRKNKRSFRIGDSTMPFRDLEIPNPYVPFVSTCNGLPKQVEFMTFLDQLRNQSSPLNNLQTFLYSGGLHHIFRKGNFNVPTTVNLLVRTLCQDEK